MTVDQRHEVLDPTCMLFDCICGFNFRAVEGAKMGLWKASASAAGGLVANEALSPGDVHVLRQKGDLPPNDVDGSHR